MRERTDLHVEMYDVLGVNKLDSLANLSHEYGTAALGQYEVVVDDSLEKLATLYTAIEWNFSVCADVNDSKFFFS